MPYFQWQRKENYNIDNWCQYCKLFSSIIRPEHSVIENFGAFLIRLNAIALLSVANKRRFKTLIIGVYVKDIILLQICQSIFHLKVFSG